MTGLATVLTLLFGGGMAETCSIEGKVVMKRDGKAADSPLNRVVVFLPEYRDGDDKLGLEHHLRQVNEQFDQPLMVIRAHDKVIIDNEQAKEHNVFARRYRNEFGPTQLSTSVVTDQRGMRQIGHTRIQCNIHGWMRTDVLVIPNRAYAIVSDDEGSFTIKGLRPGTYRLAAWEPNSQTEHTLAPALECQGVTKAGAFTILEASEPVLTHADGQPFTGEYVEDKRSRADRFRRVNP